MLKEEVDEGLKAQDKFNEFYENLESFCRPSAEILNWTIIENVQINENTVTVNCAWRGNYQARDTGSFEFPTEWLWTWGRNEVATLLKAQHDLAQKMEYEKKTQENEERKRLRESALQKMTEEEKKALGYS